MVRHRTQMKVLVPTVRHCMIGGRLPADIWNEQPIKEFLCRRIRYVCYETGTVW